VIGVGDVAAALGREELRCVVIPAESPAREAELLAERAERAGVAVHRVAARRYERLRGSNSDAPSWRSPDPTRAPVSTR